MLLELEKVRYKNFLASGNTWTEIVLNKGIVTAVVGKNGSGKSTFLDAITFALYGKPVRKINKPSLVNVKNTSGLIVELYFNINGLAYKVIRGMKPDIFEIWCDDKLIPQTASARDYQQQLESNIIKTNYINFTQSVIISKAIYKPFMQLESMKRREFIEDIFGLSIFAIMSKLHNTDFNILKNNINDTKTNIKIYKDRCESLGNSIKSLTKIVEQNNQEKIDKLIKDKEDLLKLIDGYNNEIENIKSTLKPFISSDYDSKKAMYKKFEDLKIKLDYKYNICNNKLSKLLSNTICDTCNQELNADHIEKHKAEYVKELETLTFGIKEIKVKIEKFNSDIQVLEDVKKFNANINAAIKDFNTKIQLSNNQISGIDKEQNGLVIDYSEINETKNKLKNQVNQYNTCLDKKAELEEEYEYYNIIQSFLKDSGIKASIIDKVMPIVNKLINQNLAKFGFFVNFSLDKEFNETIKLRGIDKLSYYNFSEGEKLRIDLAILLAWRDISALQSSMKFNCLFLDEITDASMDNEGTEILGTLLSEIKDTSIFIVTHTPEKLESSIRSYIRFEKHDGFSRMQK